MTSFPPAASAGLLTGGAASSAKVFPPQSARAPIIAIAYISPSRARRLGGSMLGSDLPGSIAASMPVLHDGRVGSRVKTMMLLRNSPVRSTPTDAFRRLHRIPSTAANQTKYLGMVAGVARRGVDNRVLIKSYVETWRIDRSCKLRAFPACVECQS